MASHRPGRMPPAAILLLAAALTVGAAGGAKAQANSNFSLSGNLSGNPGAAPFSPLPFDRPAPAPLVPEPGGAITSQTVTMPVPPLARTTLPSAGGAGLADSAKADAAPDEGPSHAALDDRALAKVH